MFRANRSRPPMGIMLLLYQVGAIGYDRIPPITLLIVGLQTSIYLRLFSLPWYKASQVCISTYYVWYKGDYKRLLYGALEHGDDMHLYYNMASFIIKGQALERRFGSMKFLYLTSAFTVLTSCALIGINLVANEWNIAYGNECAVGFSGVIFALKVLTSYYNPSEWSYVMGILVPGKYVAWVELVLIQVLVPNASFFGHLAGILVGLAYVKGPLGPVLDGIYSVVASIFSPPLRRFVPRRETSGYRTESMYAGMSEEEQIRQATDASIRSHLDAEELRRRRLSHYQ